MRSIEQMRPPPDWMMTADLYILDFFDQVEITLSPLVLAFELDYSRQYVSKRCRTLTGAGLLTLPRGEDSHGLYALTDFGRRFLNDELTDEESERLAEFTD
jgi:DNA-binding transcriptional ArsR family regulator